MLENILGFLAAVIIISFLLSMSFIDVICEWINNQDEKGDN